MKQMFLLLVMAMAPRAMNAQDRTTQVQPEKATTQACCNKNKKDGVACHKDNKGKEACCKDKKSENTCYDKNKKTECKKDDKKGSCCAGRKTA